MPDSKTRQFVSLTNRISRLVAIGLVAMTCSACLPADDDSKVAPTDGGATVTQPTPVDTRPAAGIAARLREVARQSQQDLADRLNVAVDDVTVSEARHVMWPDSSAGCPQKGYEYMQVLTEGVLIRLQHGGRVYQYHAGSVGPARYCEKPSTSTPPSVYEER